MELKRLKLTQLKDVELCKEEQKRIIGASACGCGCNGPSSTYVNGNANWSYGYSQSGGGNKLCGYWDAGTWHGSTF